jgi:hypothetical protein
VFKSDKLKALFSAKGELAVNEGIEAMEETAVSCVCGI